MLLASQAVALVECRRASLLMERLMPIQVSQ
jgi:hypothetical protein